MVGCPCRAVEECEAGGGSVVGCPCEVVEAVGALMRQWVLGEVVGCGSPCEVVAVFMR